MTSLRDKGVKIMKKIICCLATAAVAFGMLSAVTFVKADAVTAPSFTTAKVSLNENIVLKFGIENYTQDYTLTFGYKGETYEGKVENGEAAFSLVTPQYLDEVVTATLTKGEEIVTKTYSVKEYLYSLVHAKNTDETFKNYSCEKFVKMKTLAVDMLEYGAEAQKKYLSATDNLVTKDLTDAEKAYATTFAAPDENAQATLSGTKAGYEWVSAGIRFDYNVSLYFVVKPLTENAVLKLKINDNEVIDRYIVDKDGNYKFRYENVNVVDFANKYTVKVLDEAGNAIGQTLSYSVNTYVLNKHADESMGAITQAVYNYGVSAVAYETAGNGHAYDHVELLKADGSLAEVIAKPDFERKNYNLKPPVDDLNYGVDFAKARLVCSCGETKSEEVASTIADKERVYTKDDTTTEVVVNGKIYEAAVKVLYAKGITSAIEEIDGKLYFVNTFEIKGYTAEEVVPVTEGGALLKKDIVDTSVEGFVTFKTDISEYAGDDSAAGDSNKPKQGKAYGLGVKIRGELNNVAAQNQNGDVYSSLWDKDYELTFNDKVYRSGFFWGKPAVYIANAIETGVSSATFVQEDGGNYLHVLFKNFYKEDHFYRMFLEVGIGEYQELTIQSIIDGKDVTISTKVSELSDISAYIHFTTNNSNASTDGNSNLYPSSSFVGHTGMYNGRQYSAQSMQWGLHLSISSGSTTLVPLNDGILRYVFKGTENEAIEVNRCFGSGGSDDNNLSNGFVDHVLFTMYLKDDAEKTAVGSFKLILDGNGDPYLVSEKNGNKVNFRIEGKDTNGTVYGNLYRMTNYAEAKNLLNEMLKNALWGEVVTGDYVLTAQVKAKAGTPLNDGEVYELPTDDIHTFTIK